VKSRTVKSRTTSTLDGSSLAASGGSMDHFDG
jgi:hypothetical protein